MRQSLLVTLLMTVTALAVACSGTTTDPTATRTPPSPTPTTPSAQPTATAETATPTSVGAESTQAPVETTADVTVSDHPELGRILTDGSGRTLYLFTQDEREVSNCSGGCLSAWPPLVVEGAPAGGEGVAADRLGTITGQDAASQVTYNGWPLYYFARDEFAGDTNGQNSGDVWYVVSTDGGPVRGDARVNAGEHDELGTILLDGSGRTLYLFERDESGVSNCSGGCALNWPPLVTVRDPSAADGVDGDLLGSITRDDGYSQVTYDGVPLYYFANDEKPGDALGEGVGGVWSVVSVE